MIANRRVAIVTGANSGVGYAIVQRLVRESTAPLTVILACRNKSRAQEALSNLQAYFDDLQQKHLKETQSGHHHDKADPSSSVNSEKTHPYHRPELKVELVDVGSVSSVLAFVQRIKDQHHKVDYLFCNAGVLPSTGVMWGKVVMDCFRAPMDLVVRADVLVQPKQHLTEDGIGNVFAANVFGHYLMIKGLEDQLNKTEDDPGRVIWTSSMTAEKASFRDDDWQGLEAVQPYESSKWVTDLLALRLNEIWGSHDKPAGTSTGISASPSSSGTESNDNNATPTRRITRSLSKAGLTNSDEPTVTVVLPPKKKNIISISTQPGVVASGIGGLASWIVKLRIALHYILRICGEPHQTINGYHGAFANVYAALKQPVDELDYLFKYGSYSTRTGKEYLKVEKIVEYDESQAKMVLEELEKLRLSFVSS
ncbi:hypothetical protein B0O80DRAFT_136737 [Mortierella sp. GBAus27b]|nr:hypothetical protein BGX31_007376 [Mortierella sp. GBA43]KAI8350072.1 hypothetical protein B0O80DRAFT_136737 [Mortierella sp. GBAus27b]